MCTTMRNMEAKKPRGRPRLEAPENDRIDLRVTTERKERYSRAAQKAGETLSAWIKRVLDRASR